MDDGTVKQVVCPQRRAQQFVIGDDETESDLSLGSRSFLNRVNDQVRKRQKQSSIDAAKDSEEHSVIWRMFVSSTLQASVFMEKNKSDNWHSIKNTKDLTMKHIFDISEKLISEQSDEIHGSEDNPQSEWDKMAQQMMVTLAESGHPVFRATSPLSRGQLSESPNHFRRTSRISVLRTVCGCKLIWCLQIICELLQPLRKISQTVVRISTIIHLLLMFWVSEGDRHHLRGAISSLRSNAGLDDELDESYGGDVEDESLPELVDNPGTTVGTTVSAFDITFFPSLIFDR